MDLNQRNTTIPLSSAQRVMVILPDQFFPTTSIEIEALFPQISYMYLMVFLLTQAITVDELYGAIGYETVVEWLGEILDNQIEASDHDLPLQSQSEALFDGLLLRFELFQEKAFPFVKALFFQPYETLELENVVPHPHDPRAIIVSWLLH